MHSPDDRVLRQARGEFKRFLLAIESEPTSEIMGADEIERGALDLLDAPLDHGPQTRRLAFERLGWVAWSRFKAVAETGKIDERYRDFGRALGFYEAALSLTEAEDLCSLRRLHTALGTIYLATGQLQQCKNQFEVALRYCSRLDDAKNSAKLQLRLAHVELANGQLELARALASAAYAVLAKDDREKWTLLCSDILCACP